MSQTLAITGTVEKVCEAIDTYASSLRGDEAAEFGKAKEGLKALVRLNTSPMKNRYVVLDLALHSPLAGGSWITLNLGYTFRTIAV